MDEKIELLSVSLLESEGEKISELKDLAGRLKLEFGWHYLLDISWIIRQIEVTAGKRIIDAGAGTGVIQWYLAESGATVISIDRANRANLPLKFRRRFRVEGLRSHDLSSTVIPDGLNRRTMKSLTADWIDQIRYGFGQRSANLHQNSPGEVIIYNQDLTELVDIADDSIDSVVAVSSLEHNSPQDLEAVVAELMRVLKPGGALLATLGASKVDDWFHEPSQGWCYSEKTLRNIFQIPTETPSNYSQYDLLFENLINNKELQENLASFYYQSGDNGMPWGVWNPEYLPVGICKIKRELYIVS
ncbi:MAG: class I SAM-dependent methyltransferase [Anaerolineales bacterium]